MLEDDLERIRRFRAIVARHHFDVAFIICRTVSEFKLAYLSLTEAPDLICLDHDLIPDSPSDPDPGDGRDISEFLIMQPADCPVLIHSTNSIAADAMLYSMRDAGWKVKRIAPIGDDWIEEYWHPTACEFIASFDDHANEE